MNHRQVRLLHRDKILLLFGIMVAVLLLGMMVLLMLLSMVILVSVASVIMAMMKLLSQVKPIKVCVLTINAEEDNGDTKHMNYSRISF